MDRLFCKSHGFHCAAALISRRYLLTAAHCVRTKRLSLIGARLGEHDFEKYVDCQGTRCANSVLDFEVSVDDATVHPGYDPSVFSNDIALIRLRKDVGYSGSVEPICLPVQFKARSRKLKKNVKIAGWGETENGTSSSVLLKISVPVVPNERCSDLYVNVTSISHRQLCAGGMGDVDTCRGDSGGPLMSKVRFGKTNKMVQFGIVSFGSVFCGKKNYPGVYTRVTSYLSWILDNMKP